MIKNYTTEVGEQRTIAEIQGLLAEKGARSVSVDYDAEGRTTAVSFVIVFQEMPIPFQLPCNFEGVFRAMSRAYRDQNARRNYERNPKSRDQARRIAWRIIKDWVAAQMALIEAEQATLAQVFLPYAVMQDGNARLSMYDKFLAQVSSQRALAGKVGA